MGHPIITGIFLILVVMLPKTGEFGAHGFGFEGSGFGFIPLSPLLNSQNSPSHAEILDFLAFVQVLHPPVHPGENSSAGIWEHLVLLQPLGIFPAGSLGWLQGSQGIPCPIPRMRKFPQGISDPTPFPRKSPRWDGSGRSSTPEAGISIRNPRWNWEVSRIQGLLGLETPLPSSLNPLRFPGMSPILG